MTMQNEQQQGAPGGPAVDPAVRAYFRGLSAKAAQARRAIPADRRQAIARQAARKRWAAVRAVKRAAAMAKATRMAADSNNKQ